MLPMPNSSSSEEPESLLTIELELENELDAELEDETYIRDLDLRFFAPFTYVEVLEELAVRLRLFPALTC